MTGTQKTLVGIGVVAVIGAAAFISTTRGSGRGVEVRMETIERRDLAATVTASGNLRPRRSVDMSSDISARVASLAVQEGDDVEEGQVLLRLDRTRLEAVRARAEAALSQARAQASQTNASLTQARRNYERMSDLWARDSLLVSRQQVEDAETALEVAEANAQSADYSVEQARASLAEAEDQLSKTVFNAPMSGKITRLQIEEGETVVVGTMNNPGSLILTISDLSVVEVVVQVDETDVTKLELGDSAVVEVDAFENMEFTGRITEIGNSAVLPPASQQASGQQAAIDYEVVITLDPTEALLRPDLSATADIITDTRKQAIAVPIIALTVREDTTAAAVEASEDESANEIEGAFVVREGTASFVPVEIGITGREYFEVLSGLEVGDTVVAGPYQIIRQLRDGDPVQEMDETAASESGSGN